MKNFNILIENNIEFLKLQIILFEKGITWLNGNEIHLLEEKFLTSSKIFLTLKNQGLEESENKYKMLLSYNTDKPFNDLSFKENFIKENWKYEDNLSIEELKKIVYKIEHPELNFNTYEYIQESMDVNERLRILHKDIYLLINNGSSDELVYKHLGKLLNEISNKLGRTLFQDLTLNNRYKINNNIKEYKDLKSSSIKSQSESMKADLMIDKKICQIINNDTGENLESIASKIKNKPISTTVLLLLKRDLVNESKIIDSINKMNESHFKDYVEDQTILYNEYSL